MAFFNLGQFRKSNFNNYTTPMSSNLESIFSEVDGVRYRDNGIFPIGEEFLYGKNYYLSFTVTPSMTQIREPLEITVYLRKIVSAQESTQAIYSCKILNNTPVTFETLFTPNDNYNHIIVKIKRIDADLGYSHYQGNNSWRGRDIEIEPYKIEKINNILPHLGIETIAKLGVQGPPGLLLCINGEEIRVGKSGIYEFMNGVVVGFLSVIPKEQENFILDYQYK